MKPLVWLVALGCTGAALAAVGGYGALAGAILCLITLGLFCLFYQKGYFEPGLPPARVSRKTMTVAGWIVVAILWALALLAILRLLRK